MFRWRWLLCLILLLTGITRGTERLETPAQINLVSEQWLEYTNADGTGLGWDLLRAVFEPAGVSVRERIASYTRAVGLVQRGEADAWVGSYREETDALYPRWHYDVDRIFALGLSSKPVPSLDDLGRTRLAWVRGYQFEHFLPGLQYYNEVDRRTGVLAMLDHDRTDYYIDAQPEIQFILKDASEPARYRFDHLIDLPLYVGFADTPRGRALRQLFDERMDTLVSSGQLRAIFARWRQPYPFESGRPASAR